MTEKNKNIKGFVVKGLIVLSYIGWYVYIAKKREKRKKRKNQLLFALAISVWPCGFLRKTVLVLLLLYSYGLSV